MKNKQFDPRNLGIIPISYINFMNVLGNVNDRCSNGLFDQQDDVCDSAVNGFGSIGKHVARRLAGFDCQILAYDPIPDEAYARTHQVTLVSLEELSVQSDFLSLHLPLLPETRALVNEDFLRGMKQGAFLINTSRGELIDDNALATSIQRGHLQGAALDVFSKEPPDVDNPLLKLPRVLVTPHCASHTDGAMNAMGWMALHDCLAVLRGEKPQNPV